MPNCTHQPKVRRFIAFCKMGLLGVFFAFSISCTMSGNITSVDPEVVTSLKKVYLDTTRLTLNEGSVAIINIAVDDKYDTDTVVGIQLQGAAGRFQSLPSTIAIPARTLSRPLVLQTINDNIYEGTQTFNLTISGADSGVRAEPANLVITLIDDEPMPIITVGNATSNEGTSPMNFMVSLDRASAYDISFDWSTVDGSATAGSDYVGVTSGHAVIPAGQTSLLLPVVILDDALIEGNETFNINLANPVGGTLATSSVLGTILDDDGVPHVQFSTVSSSFSEGAGTVTVHLELDVVSALPVTVAYSTSGTAQNGADYTLSPAASAVISAGSLGTDISLTIVDDSLNENSETLVLTLGAVSNAAYGGNTIHTVTITDNDPQPSVQLSSAGSSQSESAGTVTVNLVLSAASGRDVTVPFAIGGTATGGGVDYTFSDSTPVTIPAGTTVYPLSITIVDDALSEATETVVVTLGAPMGATLGATQTYTLNILDNDLGAFNISGIANPDNGDASIDAYLSNTVYPAVNWSVSSGATGYAVTIYQDDGVTVQCATQNTSGTMFLFGTCALTPGQYYRAGVVASNALQDSPAQNDKYRFYVNRNPSILASGPWYVLSNGTITINALYAAPPALGVATDPDVGQGLTFSAAANGTRGTVTGVGGASITYTPDSPLSTGVDSIAFTISDGVGGTVSGSLSIYVVTAFTWTGALNNTWSSGAAGNWCGSVNANKNGCTGTGTVPGASDVAVIDATCSSANCSPMTNYAVSVKGVRLGGSILTQGAGFAMTVGTSGWTQNGGTFNGSNANISLDQAGSFSLSAGTFNSTTATLTVTAFSVSGTGSFVPSTGKVCFGDGSYSSTPKTISANNQQFNNVKFMNYGYTIDGGGSNLLIAGNLELASSGGVGGGPKNNMTLSVSGNTTLTNYALAGGNAILKLVGSGNQSIDGSASASGNLGSLQIASTGGTVTYIGAIRVIMDYMVISGTVDPSAATLYIGDINSYQNGATYSLQPGNEVYPNVVVNSYSGYHDLGTKTLNVSTSLTLDSKVNQDAFRINNGTVLLTGNLTVKQKGFYSGTANLKIAGSSNQTLDFSSSSGGRVPKIEIASTGGTVSVLGDMYIMDTFRHTSGTVDWGTSKLVFGDSTLYTARTFYFYGNSQSYNGLSVDCYACGLNLGSQSAIVNGLLYINNPDTAGTNIANGTIYAKGNITTQNYAFRTGNAAIIISGNGNQDIDASLGNSRLGLRNVEINSTGGTVRLLLDVRFLGNFKYTAGTVDFNGKTAAFGTQYMYESGAYTITTNGLAFGDVDINAYGPNYSFAGQTVTINGKLTISTPYPVYLNSGTLNVSGDLVLGNIADLRSGTASIRLVGSTNTLLDAYAGSWENVPSSTLYVNKSGGASVTLVRALNFSSYATNLNIMAGVFDMAGFTFSAGNITNSGTLKKGVSGSCGTLTYSVISGNAPICP